MLVVHESAKDKEIAKKLTAQYPSIGAAVEMQPGSVVVLRSSDVMEVEDCGNGQD